MTDVTTEEVVRRLGEEGLVVLDVRSTHEYTGDRSRRAIRVLGEFPARRTWTCRS